MLAKVYECYCEKTRKAQFCLDNFSLFVASKKKPSKAKLEAHLSNILRGYRICYITDDICVDLSGCDIIGVDL